MEYFLLWFICSLGITFGQVVSHFFHGFFPRFVEDGTIDSWFDCAYGAGFGIVSCYLLI